MSFERDPVLDAPTIGDALVEGRCLDDRFDVGPLVARGGMGDVHRGIDRTNGQSVAIKLMAVKFAGDAELRQRFRREAEALATLDHDNIVKVIAIGEADDLPYIVMEWLDGGTLVDRIRATGGLTSDAVVDAGRQLLAALAHIHAAGLVHRDVKPANFMLGDDGVGTLLDFGIARDPEHRMTETGATLGTPEFMAPEQARDPRLADVRSDLYAVGATLYAAWVGAPPYSGSSGYEIIHQHHEGPIPKPSKHRPELSAGIDAFIERALAKEPEDRFATAQKMADALTRLDAPDRHRGWVVAAAIAFATIAIAIGVASVTGSSNPMATDHVETPPVSAPPRLVIPDEPPPVEEPTPTRQASPTLQTKPVHRSRPLPRATRAEPRVESTAAARPSVAFLRVVTLDRGMSTFAEVTIDDGPARHSPVAKWRVESGTHVVRVRREGFVPIERRIQLDPGETKKIELSLVRAAN